MKKGRRVVVTGLGVISALGIGWKDFWDGLLDGKSGISEVDCFDTSPYDRKYAGQVKNFHPEQFFAKAKLRYLGRASQFAVAAAKFAAADAGLKKKDMDPLRTGVYIGTTMGEGQVMERFADQCARTGTSSTETLLPLIYPANALNFHIASEFNLRGEAGVFGNACAAGNFALGHAADLIHSGRMSMMFAGGCDPLSRIAFTGFHRLVSMAEKQCRPFDKNRTGMIPGEGAGVLLLEELEHAQCRGAKIYAEVLGYGASSDAHHMTQPHVNGGILSVSKALTDAGIAPGDVDYISAHGTGTLENDKVECAVFRRIFGDHAKQIPVSSIKSMLGHTMGASAALEAAVCCLAIQEGKIPPTINYETPDPECDVDCVPNVCRKHQVSAALNNSLAFGGNNFAMIFRKMV